MFAKTMILLGTSMMLPAAAYAATLTIVGTNAEARACYEAAEAADYAMPGPEALDTCNRAMLSSDLNYNDRIATLVNRGIIQFRLAHFDRSILQTK